jgi:hypothetical protein
MFHVNPNSLMFHVKLNIPIYSPKSPQRPLLALKTVLYVPMSPILSTGIPQTLIFQDFDVHLSGCPTQTVA